MSSRQRKAEKKTVWPGPRTARRSPAKSGGKQLHKRKVWFECNGVKVTA